MKISYEEGAWFAVPLRNGGVAIGLVARTARKGGVFLGYFFGPRRKAFVDLREVQDLRPENAVLVAQVGDLSLIRGDWPIVGYSAAWKRPDWPIPPFRRVDPLTHKVWRVQYSDLDANVIVSEEPLSRDDETIREDSLLGSGAAELVLTNLLSQDS